MFTSRVVAPLPAYPESEDIFSAGLSSLFTDDTQNSHGTPGSSVIYKSPRFGDIALKIPAHPDVEEGRGLFAHYLWNAGVIAADAIEMASSPPVGEEPSATEGKVTDSNQTHKGPASWHVSWDRRYWDMREKRVLELGAGTALPSLIAALSGTKSITITDHPSSPALVTGAIEQNVKTNLFFANASALPVPKTGTVVNVFGYTWGTSKMYSNAAYGQAVPDDDQPIPKSFDKIIIADCLWMPSQHANLVKTILHYLAEGSVDDGGSCPCALVIAGFHTGRSIVQRFFDVVRNGSEKTATEDGQDCSAESGAEKGEADGNGTAGPLQVASIFEIDVEGNCRSYAEVRPDEDKHAAKRWCVCAVLVRKGHRDVTE